jgi:hypothetical protein
VGIEGDVTKPENDGGDYVKRTKSGRMGDCEQEVTILMAINHISAIWMWNRDCLAFGSINGSRRTILSERIWFRCNRQSGRRVRAADSQIIRQMNGNKYMAKE